MLERTRLLAAEQTTEATDTGRIITADCCSMLARAPRFSQRPHGSYGVLAAAVRSCFQPRSRSALVVE
jgi:hypothetical protein